MNESKLDEGHEDKCEAYDDIDIQSSGVGYSSFIFFPNEAHCHNSCNDGVPYSSRTDIILLLTQTASDAQPHPGHYLSPGRGPHQPETHPGAGSDDNEREVGPHKVVPDRPTECELHIESGPTT